MFWWFFHKLIKLRFSIEQTHDIMNQFPQSLGTSLNWGSTVACFLGKSKSEFVNLKKNNNNFCVSFLQSEKGLFDSVYRVISVWSWFKWFIICESIYAGINVKRWCLAKHLSTINTQKLTVIFNCYLAGKIWRRNAFMDWCYC